MLVWHSAYLVVLRKTKKNKKKTKNNNSVFCLIFVTHLGLRDLLFVTHWRTPHMLSCSLVQTIGSLEIYFRVFFLFFIKELAYQMCTLGHTLYQFYRMKWMIFFHE